MKRSSHSILVQVGLLLACGTLTVQADATVKEVMKTYHKAPAGEDPVCKQVSNGQGTEQQIKDLLDAYKKLAKAKPAAGDSDSWEKKTAALISATEKLTKDSKDVADYKAAVNCKACHDVHKE